MAIDLDRDTAAAPQPPVHSAEELSHGVRLSLLRRAYPRRRLTKSLG
jgi:hypothetical protein